jgi:hypothetical protein
MPFTWLRAIKLLSGRKSDEFWRRFSRYGFGLMFALSFPAAAYAVIVQGAKKINVRRVYFHDYANNSRYTQAEVQGFFANINTLWGTHSSYGAISISAEVNGALIELPDDRSSYVDDFSDGDLSNGPKYQKVLDDAVANSSGLDWNNVDAVMVVMSETDPSQSHRGQGNKCNLHMGPGSTVIKFVGCAIFSENPSDSDALVWGRWAHELGHAFQAGGPAHPSNYNSYFEQMDHSLPGQTGVFEKQDSVAFGWMPASKYKTVLPATGGAQVALYAEEYDPSGKPNLQAIKAFLGSGGSAYYLVIPKVIVTDRRGPSPAFRWM